MDNVFCYRPLIAVIGGLHLSADYQDFKDYEIQNTGDRIQNEEVPFAQAQGKEP